MAPAHTATLTRDTTTDQKTLPRAHQSAPRAPHQTDVVFPPKCDSRVWLQPSLEAAFFTIRSHLR
jgi:hypothetical protein